jgi:hypothetical protein
LNVAIKPKAVIQPKSDRLSDLEDDLYDEQPIAEPVPIKAISPKPAPAKPSLAKSDEDDDW